MLLGELETQFYMNHFRVLLRKVILKISKIFGMTVPFNKLSQKKKNCLICLIQVNSMLFPLSFFIIYPYPQSKCVDFNIYFSVASFITSIARIGSPNYVPSATDILHTRTRTIGIETSNLSLTRSDINIARSIAPPLEITVSDVITAGGVEVYDMGGARGERRKWLHFFEGASRTYSSLFFPFFLLPSFSHSLLITPTLKL